MATPEVIIKIQDMDGAMSGLRREFAELLRDHASSHPPEIRRVLLDIADIYEGEV